VSLFGNGMRWGGFQWDGGDGIGMREFMMR
jgi:hypothetical protein